MNTRYHPETPQSQPPQEDSRASVIKAIWGCATGMLGICIPLSAVMHGSPIMPICVVAGAAFGTVAVALGFGKSTDSVQNRLAANATEEKLRELEERLANVEIISNYERGLAERTPLDVQPAAVPMSAVPASSLPASTVPPPYVEAATPAEEDVLAPEPQLSSYKKTAPKEYRNSVKNQPLSS